MHLFEDLYTLGSSQKILSKVNAAQSVLNTKNRSHGVKARRGDGSFGTLVPNESAILDPGYNVRRGPIAGIQVGVEVKILMKAMIKQIDRVCSDLRGQAAHFRSKGGNPICVGIVGINQAPYTTSYEGTRIFKTDGKKYQHPAAEAAEAEARVIRDAAGDYDELLILRFSATNEAPFVFSWLNAKSVSQDYGAMLVRLSQDFDARF